MQKKTWRIVPLKVQYVWRRKIWALFVSKKDTIPMQDLLLAAAFVAMILSPLALNHFRSERSENVKTSNGAQPTR